MQSLPNAEFSRNTCIWYNFFNIFTYILLSTLFLSSVILIFNVFEENKYDAKSYDLENVAEVIISTNSEESRPENKSCSFWDCVNLYKCHTRLTVYVYPLQEYIDTTTGKSVATLSREYYEILNSVVRSPYYTSDPNEACLLLPSVDLLNQKGAINTTIINRALGGLDFWDNGENHILFNVMPGHFQNKSSISNINTDRAIILGGGFDSWTYRRGFDIALPVWSTKLWKFKKEKLSRTINSKYLVVGAQLNVIPNYYQLLKTIVFDNPTQFLLLRMCGKQRCNVMPPYEKYEYPRVLTMGTFCLICRSTNLRQPDLLEILAYNCIPVVAIDEYVLPFEDVIDWSLATIRIRESELYLLTSRLQNISRFKIMEMQENIDSLYNRYFKDLSTIALSALEILENRIFPLRAQSVRQSSLISSNSMDSNPLFLPIIAPKSQGFTAVVLTYDRLDSLYILLQKLSVVPSLQSILVIWNNPKKIPPNISQYPTLNKPLKIIRTRGNKLSNRFYPYAEIETEAILTIDDDILMLTADELDFGFEVWREFPDRIVGFPSRVHVWNSKTMRWQYESEWTNHISMVLTGAAFHHKFWNHLYTYSMPGNIKEWVDDHMNCEDIAMNFLVANITKKPPIKVTPRKKFKCPECINTEMLSADLNHMRERSSCIDRFASIYGRMPLRSVEFRADPVLYRDSFPDKLKRFNDVGSL